MAEHGNFEREAAVLVEAFRTFDPEGTGEITLVQLDEFFRRVDSWWDAEKLHMLTDAAGLISEHGRIRYAEFVDWVMAPVSIPSLPLPRPLSRGVPAVSARSCTGNRRESSSVSVRFLHINDVYDLSRFPSLKTAIKLLSAAADTDRVVTTMGGDFLAPYLLSTLDNGLGMIDCMNSVPFSHCCFGNHECDVPHEALLRAIETFQGKWINSNMPGGGFSENERLPTQDVIEVASKDGHHRRRIGLLGLLCDYSYLYREGVFNGAVSSIEEVNSCCERMSKELTSQHGCDVVVPMTHQNSSEDVELAMKGRDLRIPVILGGHDHTEVCERFAPPQKKKDLLQAGSLDGNSGNSCTLVKAGMDAVKLGVVDLTWDSPNSEWPRVDARLLTTLDFDKDPDMVKVVEKHMTKVWALDLMVACRRKDMEELSHPGVQFPLSSLTTRTGESSMATLLCSALRDALGADVALLEGGSVRGGSDKYHDLVTVADLKAELPFKNDTLVLPLPGAVLEAAVRTSREKAVAKGRCAFLLHCDNGCVVDPASHSLTQVAGQPFDPDRVYSVAVGVDLGVGSGVNEPLLRWAATAGEGVVATDTAIQAEPVLEVFFIRRLWECLPTFEEIDTRDDGFLTYDEIEDAYISVFFPDAGELSKTEQLAVKEMVQHLTKVLDKAQDMRVSREEYAGLRTKGKPWFWFAEGHH